MKIETPFTSKGPSIVNEIWSVKWSSDRWRHVPRSAVGYPIATAWRLVFQDGGELLPWIWSNRKHIAISIGRKNKHEVDRITAVAETLWPLEYSKMAALSWIWFWIWIRSNLEYRHYIRRPWKWIGWSVIAEIYMPIRIFRQSSRAVHLGPICEGIKWRSYNYREGQTIGRRSYSLPLERAMVYTPCPRKNYNCVYVVITLANNVGL